MRKRVQIQAPTPVTSDFGGETEAWTTIATVWGAFAPQSPGSGESERAEQQVNVSRTVVTLRWASSVPLTTKYRLIMNGRTFGVDNIVNVDERNRELTVVCKEVT